MERIYDLEERLVRFAGEVIFFCRTVKPDYEGTYLKNQLIRSSSASALNFGEVQGTETTRDFNHKNSIVLKELKESRVSLKLLKYIDYGDPIKREALQKECEEIIRICYSRRKK